MDQDQVRGRPEGDPAGPARLHGLGGGGHLRWRCGAHREHRRVGGPRAGPSAGAQPHQEGHVSPGGGKYIRLDEHGIDG